MSTMVAPEHAPKWLVEQITGCSSCEQDRRPRMFVCDYHEGWWDGYETGYRQFPLSRFRHRIARWLCPEHGILCGGDECCCRDKHRWWNR